MCIHRGMSWMIPTFLTLSRVPSQRRNWKHKSMVVSSLLIPMAYTSSSQQQTLTRRVGFATFIVGGTAMLPSISKISGTFSECCMLPDHLLKGILQDEQNGLYEFNRLRSLSRLHRFRTSEVHKQETPYRSQLQSQLETASTDCC